jgi:hypothetical protein
MADVHGTDFAMMTIIQDLAEAHVTLLESGKVRTEVCQVPLNWTDPPTQSLGLLSRILAASTLLREAPSPRSALLAIPTNVSSRRGRWLRSLAPSLATCATECVTRAEAVWNAQESPAGLAMYLHAQADYFGSSVSGRQCWLGGDTPNRGAGLFSIATQTLNAVARAADGRGQSTSLQAALSAHFELKPRAIVQRLSSQELPWERVFEIVPLVFTFADVDEVASKLVDWQIEEIIRSFAAIVRRLKLHASELPVILDTDSIWLAEPFLGRLRKTLLSAWPHATTRLLEDGAQVGAERLVKKLQLGSKPMNA